MRKDVSLQKAAIIIFLVLAAVTMGFAWLSGQAPDKPKEIIETAPPVETTQPVETTPPAEAEPPVEAAPAEAEPPVEAAPAEAEPPVEEAAPAEAEPPVEAAPAEAEPPVEAAPPAEVEPPVEAAPPAEVEPPVEAAPTTEAEPPAEATPPAEAEPPVEAAPAGDEPPVEVTPPAEDEPPADATPPAETEPLVETSVAATTVANGKVAIITMTESQNEEEYRAGEQFLAKYGPERVIHVTWPDNFMGEQAQMISILARFAADPDVKGIVINQAVPGTNAAVDKLLETRKDIFIAYCNPQEDPPDVSARASVVLIENNLALGDILPLQAQALGAKTFIHYSFPRHMAQPLLSGRRDSMMVKCAELGIEFLDVEAPDPMSEIGLPGAQQFILDDVPKMVAKYGADTAFFSTNCGMQIPLIKAVVEEKAIYPQPCCPSPYHGFPAALGINSDLSNPDNLQFVIDETRRILKEKGMEGRLSTWAAPLEMAFGTATAEYAMRIANGETSLSVLNKEVLDQCLVDYAKVPVTTVTYVDDDGREFPNFLLVLIEYITY